MQKSRIQLPAGRIAEEQMLIRAGKKPKMVLSEELEKIRRHRYPIYVLNSLKLEKGDKFLDIGSSPMVAVAAWKRGAEATGIDTDRTRVSFGRKLADWAKNQDIGELNCLTLTKIRDVFGLPEMAQKGIRFMHGSPARIPMPPSSVDKIMSLSYLHELPPVEREQVLREILRVAKDGARIKIMSAPYLHEGRKINAQMRLQELAKELGHGYKVTIAGKGIATTIRLFKTPRRVQESQKQHD